MRPSASIAFIIISVGAFLGCAARKMKQATPAAPAPAAEAPAPATIPGGTSIEVRTNEAIKSETATEGRTYQAEIAREITGEKGKVLIPKSSPAEIVVLKISEGGRVKGSSLELGLRSIILNGKEYAVNTTGVRKASGLGANQRTAEMLGGGALLGTVLGGTAGGAKGAAIGAAAGAAAGAAIQVLTNGKDLHIPAETVLTFRLEQSLQLNQASSP